jgi:hypothetical protein
LWIPPGRHIAGHDPITVLATRMYAAGQLDDNAFHAVDADASRLATSLTRAGGDPRRAAMTLVTQAEVRLAPAVTAGISPALR